MCPASIVQSCPEIQSVMQRLLQGLCTGDSLIKTERWLFGWLLKLGRTLLQAAVDELLADDVFCNEMRAQARQELGKMRSKGRAKVTVTSLFGVLHVITTHWVVSHKGRRGPRRLTRRKGGTGVYPILWVLGIYDRCTPALQAEVSRAMVLCSSCREASDLLATRGISLAPKQVCRLAYSVGLRALMARDHRLDHPGAIPAEERLCVRRRIAVAIDGGRYRARLNNTAGRRTAKGRQGFKTPWKEPKGFIIYVLDEHGRPDRSFKPLCDFTTGDADETFSLLLRYLRAHGADEAIEIVFLADGAHWIWNRIGQVNQALGLEKRDVKVTEVLDFYHAVEHLAELSRLPGRWSERKRKMWLKRQRRALKAGDLQSVQDAIGALGNEVAKKRRRDFKREEAYFNGDNEERMRYAAFKSEQLPRGSGAIESAIRRVINQRVKSNGMFWKPENAEVVMHMRAQLKTARFAEMIRHATSTHARAAA